MERIENSKRTCDYCAENDYKERSDGTVGNFCRGFMQFPFEKPCADYFGRPSNAPCPRFRSKFEWAM